MSLRATCRATALATLALFAQSAGIVRADESHEGVVLELGGAAEWPTRGGATNFGGTVAAEVTPIEDWLEIEAGVTALGSTGRTELSGDVLFKKPWTLSPRTEIMVGAGPSWGRTLNGPDKGTALSAAFVLDFMFWQWRDIGWYFEPGWTVTPKTWDRSVEVDGGLIIRLP